MVSGPSSRSGPCLDEVPRNSFAGSRHPDKNGLFSGGGKADRPRIIIFDGAAGQIHRRILLRSTQVEVNDEMRAIGGPERETYRSAVGPK